MRFSKSRSIIRIFDSYRYFYLLRLDLFVYTRIASTFLFWDLHIELPFLYLVHWYAGFCILPIGTGIAAALSSVIFSWIFIRYLRPIVSELVGFINSFFFGFCVSLVDLLATVALMVLASLTKLITLCICYLLAALVDYLLSRLIGLILYPIRPILSLCGLDRLRLLRPLKTLVSNLLSYVWGAWREFSGILAGLAKLALIAFILASNAIVSMLASLLWLLWLGLVRPLLLFTLAILLLWKLSFIVFIILEFYLNYSSISYSMGDRAGIRIWSQFIFVRFVYILLIQG
jgi:hypothetical protein